MQASEEMKHALNGNGNGHKNSVCSVDSVSSHQQGHSVDKSHIAIMEPDDTHDFPSFSQGEEVPNDSFMDFGNAEDTGRVEERVDDTSETPKKGASLNIPKHQDFLSLFRHLKDIQGAEDAEDVEDGGRNSTVDENAENGKGGESTQRSQQLQQLQQQLSKYLHHHFNSGVNSEESHRFQSRLLRGFKKARGDDNRNNRRRSTMVFKDSIQELDYKNQEKMDFIITSLTAGYPEVLFTSSYFLNDEHSQRKVPLLLSFLSLSITEVTRSKHSKRRVFKLYLEYGLGNDVLRWTLLKDYKQLMSFHNKLRIQVLQTNVLFKGTEKRVIKIPKFPKLKDSRNYSSTSEMHSPLHTPTEISSPLRQSTDFTSYNSENGHAHHLSSSSREVGTPADESYVTALRSIDSSISSDGAASTHSGSSIISNISNAWKRAFLKFNRGGAPRKGYSLREGLQQYFDELIKCLLLRTESTRLLQFFELSPISILLDKENVEKRKEGYLFIKTTAKAQGWKVGHLKYRDFKAMVVRHTSKWFIVGHSYIMYVSDINSTTPLDVFLVDSSFKMSLFGFAELSKGTNVSDFLKEQMQADSESSDEEDDGTVPSDFAIRRKNPYFSMTLENSERKLSVMSKSAKELKNWCLSIYEMMSQSEWSKPHRFESFAPIRTDCFAQWFVDARDYMWAASSAMEMAKDVIFIHDWWLTPELYMRRPPDGNQEWRIDRILKRKAEQGVKIFVIVYRNVINTVITDSLWTKHSLLDLHPNIHVMRSPNQWMQNVYFWAHHEKLLIVDQTVCFLGGIDICYGRWDTPDHTLIDDHPYAFQAQASSPSKVGHASCQVFPGKDYSNPRVGDFFDLHHPFQDMCDRETTPRMPWHDVHMVTCGQPARDLSRHFVQRWNYLLRQKRPSRLTPLLLPPRDFTEEELDRFHFKGTCEIQLLRSSCSWSLGLQKHEQSVQNAYMKCIETSEHFVYIENQFFITSCEVDGVMVMNRIGDALVDRIIRAHKDKETWKAVIMIPLLPGFASEVDNHDGSSVRLITRCQYMSISMGESSIYAKLRKLGIIPEDYIQFYSLRRWGMIGRKKLLVTEQLYIHAKAMIVDDRTAIIGSANINERSMRGTRDSEVCAIVRDKDMINSYMDGKKYKVGKFAHTLRMRLMREHLGVDVDLLDMVERRFSEIESFASTDLGLTASTLKGAQHGDNRLSAMIELGTRYLLKEYDGTEKFKSILTKNSSAGGPLSEKMQESFGVIDVNDNSNNLDDIPYIYSFNHRASKENIGIRDRKPFSTDTRVTTPEHRSDVLGYGEDKYQSDFYVDSKAKVNSFLRKAAEAASEDGLLPYYEDVIEFLNEEDENVSIDELNRERWVMLKRLFYMQKLESKKAYDAREQTSPSPEDAERNSATARDIKLESIPATTLSDDEIKEIDKNILPQTVTDFVDPYSFEDPLDIDFFEGMWMPQSIRNTMLYEMVFHVQPDDSVLIWKEYKRFQELKQAFMENQKLERGYNESDVDDKYPTYEGDDEVIFEGNLNQDGASDSMPGSSDSAQVHFESSEDKSESKESLLDLKRRTMRRARMTELDRFQRAGSLSGGMGPMMFGGGLVGNYGSMSVYDYETAKKLLGLIKGRVVKFPSKWLKKEVEGSNWFYKADKLPPIQIYN
ncbi:hypothetical protein FOA43_000727 [Brettanomyces nanus]|uniref:Phospholipase n=1 Tax=Eeniella nana TaxID=13502 RepID=A0A875RTE8_EENNA|nr:uncharacterized protein FOA43_000727 [Brettanomyces nanus]QPG73417.1 hypothetical protein FOA43_000727 [Brettanomyces nanus]